MSSRCAAARYALRAVRVAGPRPQTAPAPAQTAFFMTYGNNDCSGEPRMAVQSARTAGRHSLPARLIAPRHYFPHPSLLACSRGLLRHPTVRRKQDDRAPLHRRRGNGWPEPRRGSRARRPRRPHDPVGLVARLCCASRLPAFTPLGVRAGGILWPAVGDPPAFTPVSTPRSAPWARLGTALRPQQSLYRCVRCGRGDLIRVFASHASFNSAPACPHGQRVRVNALVS